MNIIFEMITVHFYSYRAVWKLILLSYRVEKQPFFIVITYLIACSEESKNGFVLLDPQPVIWFHPLFHITTVCTLEHGKPSSPCSFLLAGIFLLSWIHKCWHLLFFSRWPFDPNFQDYLALHAQLTCQHFPVRAKSWQRQLFLNLTHDKYVW